MTKQTTKKRANKHEIRQVQQKSKETHYDQVINHIFLLIKTLALLVHHVTISLCLGAELLKTDVFSSKKP
jgi:hypothetical protein